MPQIYFSRLFQRLVNCKRSGSLLTFGVCDRGRESIAVCAYVNNQPQKKPARRKKPVIPKVGLLVYLSYSVTYVV